METKFQFAVDAPASGFAARRWMPISLVLMIPFFWYVAYAFGNNLDLINHAIFKFWLAGHMIANGQNPYDIQLWLPMHTQMGSRWITNERIFLYPPALAYLLVPLGQLSLLAAFVTWGTGMLVSIATSVFLLVQRWEDRSKQPFALFIVFAAFFFTPLSMSLANSTIGGFFLLIASLSVCVPEHSSFWRGVLTGALLLKPSLGVPIGGVVGLWMLVRRDWRGIAGMAASAGLILAVSFAHDPSWVAKLAEENRNQLNRMTMRQPTLSNAGLALCQLDAGCARMVSWAAWGVLFARVVQLIVTKGRMLPPLAAMGIAITWALIATPYVWPYDYILLLLPFVWIAERLLLRTSSLVPPTVFLVIMVALTHSLMPGTEVRPPAYPSMVAVPVVTYILIEIIVRAMTVRLMPARAPE